MPQRSGYSEPLPAAQEAIADLKAHEVALIAGMQNAVAKLLAALAPAEIERRIDLAGLLASVFRRHEKPNTGKRMKRFISKSRRNSAKMYKAFSGNLLRRAILIRSKICD